MTDITIHVELPEVTESAIRIEVRCGETRCEVYEHGSKGSRDWAAWTGGHIIGEGGKRGYTQDQALDDARAFVRDSERSRLAHTELRKALGG